MHVKALITHPAPLILIHCKSANTHGRGSAVTGPWEMPTFRTSLETVTVYNPAFSEFLLTSTPWSEIRFHCPRLCSFLSRRRAVLQVTGLRTGPPTQAQGTVRAPAWQISSSAATWQCLHCTEALRREDMDTEFAKHTSFLIPRFPAKDFSELLSTSFSDV